MTNGETYIRKSLRVKSDMAELVKFLLDNDAPEVLLAPILVLRAKFDHLYYRFIDSYVCKSGSNSESKLP